MITFIARCFRSCRRTASCSCTSRVRLLQCVGVFIVVFAITRYVSLASILAAAMMPLFCLLWMPDRSPVFVGGIIPEVDAVALRRLTLMPGERIVTWYVGGFGL